MKNLFKPLLTILSLGLAMASCSSDNADVVQTNPDEDIDTTATIRLTEGGSADDMFSAEVLGKAGDTARGRVVFTTTDGTQRRLYVTQTLPGGTPEPFVIPTEASVQRRLTKPDGSIDLDDSNKDSFDFTFDLLVPDTTSEGEIVYNFWSTTGRGDFRDPTKRLLIGVGTIVVKIGVPVANRIVEGTNIELRAPLADGSSETFVSFFDLDRTYRINEGAESSTFWDFGYFFGNTGRASIVSANNYPSNIVDIVSIANAGIAADEPMVMAADLKSVYFVVNNTIDFDSITNLTELNAVIASSFTVSDADASSQRVTMLEVGNVIEFLDTSGIRGIIEVVSIVEGAGTAGVITLNVKSQPSQPIMNGSDML